MQQENKIIPQAKPFLKWAGSKRKQLPILSEYWDPSYKRYVEPFMGSACLFFYLNPKKAILNDLNSELVATYKAVRDHTNQVTDALYKLPRGKESYYEIRSKDPNELNQIEAAARFIYLNRFCFNGLYRTNLTGRFNVPYCPTKTGNLPLPEIFQAAAKQLKNAEIKSSDFEAILANVTKNDFVYIDPPFAVENQRIFRQYGPTTFGSSDLERLAEKLIFINNVGAKFVLSYASSPDVKQIFQNWQFKEIMVQRNIAGFVQYRRKAPELIFSNII
jgi:DNA adenine methylase